MRMNGATEIARPATAARRRVRGWTPFLAAGIWIAGWGCGGGGETPRAEVDDRQWEVRLESPLDTVVVVDAEELPDASPPETTAAASGTPSAPEPPPVPDPRDFTPGWRVQIFASHSLQLADGKAKEFGAVFDEPVYLEYEPPFYKVRVGDFLVKRDAETYRDRIAGRGWSGAWVAETLVLKPGS